MKEWVIVPTKWLEGRSVPTGTLRKSIDETLCIIHSSKVFPVIGSDDDFKSYDFDSPELHEILNSPDWMPEELES